jgi:hypothetical protein
MSNKKILYLSTVIAKVIVIDIFDTKNSLVIVIVIFELLPISVSK